MTAATKTERKNEEGQHSDGEEGEEATKDEDEKEPLGAMRKAKEEEKEHEEEHKHKHFSTCTFKTSMDTPPCIVPCSAASKHSGPSPSSSPMEPTLGLKAIEANVLSTTSGIPGRSSSRICSKRP